MLDRVRFWTETNNIISSNGTVGLLSRLSTPYWSPAYISRGKKTI